MENLKELNVYGKLTLARIYMQEEGIKKEGRNNFAKYDYYTLATLNPAFNRALYKARLCSHVQVTEQIAMLTIVDIDNPSSEILFSMPFTPAEMKGVTKIQEWGSSVSYFTRYLILEAMQIGECEVDVDSEEQSEARAKAEKQKGRVKKDSSQESNEETFESVKKEVQELCREKAKDKRAEVNSIVKTHNNNSQALGTIKDIEVLKKIKEEVEKL